MVVLTVSMIDRNRFFCVLRDSIWARDGGGRSIFEENFCQNVFTHSAPAFPENYFVFPLASFYLYFKQIVGVEVEPLDCRRKKTTELISRRAYLKLVSSKMVSVAIWCPFFGAIRVKVTDFVLCKAFLFWDDEDWNQLQIPPKKIANAILNVKNLQCISV